MLRRLIEAGINPLTATADQIDAWWLALAREGLAPKTMSTYRAELRAFFAWAVAYDRIKVSPARRVPSVKIPERLYDAPPRAEVLQLYAYAEEHDPVMYRAFVLAAAGGLRAAETAILSWARIDTIGQIIRVIGKGNKERAVDFGKASLERLGEPCPPEWSVLTRGVNYLTPNAVSKRASRVIRAAGLNFTLHGLRHFHGVTAYQNAGKDLDAVRRHLGHTNPATTLIYAKAAPEAGRKLADATDL
ncbi:tyrosine-type recombinase/integrase [Nocardioides sp. NPDC057772]|uniref:tyrosine-type recombinase/integrase n=1 Tax=Nocardioides sp. NPDC057772 TaxID=3346245 RepID=UPI00366FECC8